MRDSSEFHFLLEYLECSVRGLSKILKFFMTKIPDLSVAEMADDIRMIKQSQNEILFRVRDMQCPSCVSLDSMDLERN